MRQENIADHVLRASVGIKMEGGLGEHFVRALVNEFAAEQPQQEQSDAIAGFLVLEDIPHPRRREFLSALDLLSMRAAERAAKERTALQSQDGVERPRRAADALSRRALIEKARTEVARAQRYGRTLSFAALDIDRLRAINEAHGQSAGDRVIAMLADLCLSTIRQSDACGRLGGGEFGLLMPETTATGALLLAERIRTVFAATPIDLGASVRCTFSVGIAELEAADAGLDALMQRADEAVHQAKAEGRNRSVIAGDAQSAPARAA